MKMANFLLALHTFFTFLPPPPSKFFLFPPPSNFDAGAATGLEFFYDYQIGLKGPLIKTLSIDWVNRSHDVNGHACHQRSLCQEICNVIFDQKRACTQMYTKCLGLLQVLQVTTTSLAFASNPIEAVIVP